MDFNKVIEATEKAPDKIKNLLFSEKIEGALYDIAQKNNLPEEIYLKMIDEIGYVILGIKERSMLKGSLNTIGISKDVMPSIIMDISRIIFKELDNVDSSEKEMGQEITSQGHQNQPVTPSESKANLPVIEPGETAHEVPHVELKQPVTPQTPVPGATSAPIQPQAEEKKPSVPDYRYPEGKDPYREPLK